jgi:hypothetical protein
MPESDIPDVYDWKLIIHDNGNTFLFELTFSGNYVPWLVYTYDALTGLFSPNYESNEDVPAYQYKEGKLNQVGAKLFAQYPSREFKFGSGTKPSEMFF